MSGGKKRIEVDFLRSVNIIEDAFKLKNWT